jgi:hypothetical protein
MKYGRDVNASLQEKVNLIYFIDEARTCRVSLLPSTAS